MPLSIKTIVPLSHPSHGHCQYALCPYVSDIPNSSCSRSFLSTESSKDLWDLASFIHSFIHSYGWLVIHCMGIPHFHFLSNDEFFPHYLAIMNIAVNIHACVCGHLFSTLKYVPKSGIAGPKMSPFSFLLVIWSKQICRYKIGNWETGYRSQLQVKNWAGSSLLLHLERKVWSAWLATLPSVDTGLGARQLQVSVRLEWVPVLPAFLLFSPDVCCLELWVFAYTCSLDGLFSFSQASELAHMPSFSSPTLLTAAWTISGASGSHFTFITCYSAVSLLVCLTPEHRVWILFTFVAPLSFLSAVYVFTQQVCITFLTILGICLAKLKYFIIC